MKNSDRQKSLDKRKWLASEKAGTDLSGKMDYCKHCFYQGINIHHGGGCCFGKREDIEQESSCAKAYNLMIKRRAK